MFGASLASAAEPKRDLHPSAEFKARSKEVDEIEKQLSLAISKRDTDFLQKVLAETYFDAYEGEKRALSKADTLARCKAGLLHFLAIEREPRTSSEGNVIAVEGFAKLVPNRHDDLTPEEQWVHVRRLWTRKDGNWLLTGQIRRLEGDNGKGEVD
jgi:hypothetical protein